MGKGRFISTPVAVLAVALVALGLVLVNPVGFVGAGNDDIRYLTAARCWIEAGDPCLATNHWETRWPVIAPLAASLAIFGEGRTAISLGALPWWIASIALTGWLASLSFSRGVGLVAGLVMASVPVVTWFALRPNADLPELTFQLAAIGLAAAATRSGSRVGAVFAGGAVGLAIATRETSLLFLIIAAPAWWLLAPDRRRLIGWALAGLVAVVGMEWVAYAFATGDPLARYALAVGHGGIPSAYLDPGVDISKSPILNPDFIAGWIRPMGIELWWPIDWLLNLLADPIVGLWLIAGLGAAVWRLVSGRGDEKRAFTAMLVGAAILAGGLVYGLAVDPRPRMFMLPAAFGAIALGAAVLALWNSDRKLLAVVIPGALLFAGALILSQQTHVRDLEAAALDWMEDYPNAIEIDRQTGEMLAALPEARDLPVAPAGRPVRMTLQSQPCADALADGLAAVNLELVDEAQAAGGLSLCLLRYRAAD